MRSIAPMTITLLTIFPEYFQSPFELSILKRAQAKGLVELNIINLRQFTTDKRQTTDDRPFGGGPGMVMQIEPIAAALAALGLTRGQPRAKIILTSAKGTLFTQVQAIDFSQLDKLTIICGHYEGVDERVAEHLVDAEVRIGDYVLTGGEPAATVITDAVTRLLPGVLGNEASNQAESHAVVGQGGHPVYSRPETFNGWPVPPVLLSGDHQAIAAWRVAQRKPTQG